MCASQGKKHSKKYSTGVRGCDEEYVSCISYRNSSDERGVCQNKHNFTGFTWQQYEEGWSQNYMDSPLME